MENVNLEFTNWNKQIISYNLPGWEELPDIDLYMDQVVVLLEKYLNIFNNKNSDRIITPAMINNYVKLSILPPPARKRYSREHLAYLMIISILKQVLSIHEIKNLIEHQIKINEIDKAYRSFCDNLKSSFIFIINQLNGECTGKEESAAISFDDLTLKLSTAAFASKILAEKLISLQNAGQELKDDDKSQNLKPEKK